MIVESIITCPWCGHQETELMPENACRFFYDCKGCGEHLMPKPGDCCVFCSYGSVPCPPVQIGQCCRKPHPIDFVLLANAFRI
jgi:hypothetical protein